MAKRCKYSDKKTGACSCEKYYRDKDGIYHCVMEPYTTDNCNMKRKSKVRRVKAWAFVFMGKIGVQIDAYSDRNISHKGLRPCTILIDEKYLKEKNNAR